MKTTEWKLEDVIKTKDDLIFYILASTESLPADHPEWLVTECKWALDFAKRKGWWK